MDDQLGLMHVIYGDGKGKTSSSIGLAMRCLGAGYRVGVVQFMKDGTSSEISVIRELNNLEYYCPGRHELLQKGEVVRDEMREHARLALEKACMWSKSEFDMLVCDEILHVVTFGIVGEKEVLSLIDNRRQGLELVVTGMYCPRRILRRADYVSKIVSERHPYQTRGLISRYGIEK